MPQPNLNFPDDIGIALSILARFTNWLAAERARTGMTDEQIISKYESKFDSNDEQIARLLTRLKKEDETGPHTDDVERKQSNKI